MYDEEEVFEVPIITVGFPGLFCMGMNRVRGSLPLVFTSGLCNMKLSVVIPNI